MTKPTKARKAKMFSKKDAAALRELLRLVRFERAGFGHIGPTDPVHDGALPTSESEVTDFIRKRTRLYTESWVVPLIKELLKRAGDEDEKG